MTCRVPGTWRRPYFCAKKSLVSAAPRCRLRPDLICVLASLDIDHRIPELLKKRVPGDFELICSVLAGLVSLCEVRHFVQHACDGVAAKGRFRHRVRIAEEMRGAQHRPHNWQRPRGMLLSRSTLGGVHVCCWRCSWAWNCFRRNAVPAWRNGARNLKPVVFPPCHDRPLSSLARHDTVLGFEHAAAPTKA